MSRPDKRIPPCLSLLLSFDFFFRITSPIGVTWCGRVKLCDCTLRREWSLGSQRMCVARARVDAVTFAVTPDLVPVPVPLLVPVRHGIPPPGLRRGETLPPIGEADGCPFVLHGQGGVVVPRNCGAPQCVSQLLFSLPLCPRRASPRPPGCRQSPCFPLSPPGCWFGCPSPSLLVHGPPFSRAAVPLPRLLPPGGCPRGAHRRPLPPPRLPVGVTCRGARVGTAGPGSGAPTPAQAAPGAGPWAPPRPAVTLADGRKRRRRRSGWRAADG